MKFYIISLLLALFAVCALGVAPPQRSVLVSYSNDTPDEVLEQAKKAIIDAGGFITHEYKLIRGFAANAPSKILDSIQAWGTQYNALIEEDQEVHAYTART